MPAVNLPPNLLAVLAARIAELRRGGADVIRLDIGSPDLPPAPPIVEALTRAAARPEAHGYQSHRGTEALRAAWAQMYARRFGVPLTSGEVLPLLGSKEGIFHLSLAWLQPGDLVLVPDPGYQTYAIAARFAGAEPVAMPLRPENGFLPDLQAIPASTARRAALMWLNYPHNPTAATAPPAFFQQAVDFCRRHGILLCHDAAYTQVVFEGDAAPSVLAAEGAREVAVEFNTLSKSHNMAGWRVGAALGRRDALEALLRLKTHADSGHFLPVMEAAVAALTGDQTWLAARNALYAARRDAAVQALRALGLEPYPARASLYLWFPLPPGWTDSLAFVQAALEAARVALAPGVVFGPRGEGHVRLSLVQPRERIAAALARLQAWLAG